MALTKRNKEKIEREEMIKLWQEMQWEEEIQKTIPSSPTLFLRRHKKQLAFIFELILGILIGLISILFTFIITRIFSKI